MSAGMMPAFDLPGEATPGQLGPMIRVALPAALAYAQNSAVSWTGTPSVITTTSGILASIASITAALVPWAGTNTTDTSAPVASMVSPTVANTGSSATPRSTVWPALRGLVPPTTAAPAWSIRRPCLRPSEPVMPWIRIRLWLFRKIVISRPRPGRGQLGSPPRGIVHRRDLLDHWYRRLVQNAPALSRVVPVQPDHDRVPHRLAPRVQHADRRHDAVRHRVAGGDAAEHVDQDGAHRRVGQHDFQAVGHHLGRRAAADVEEVRRPHTAELFTGVGDHVQGGHDQAGAVANDADLAVQLDVVEMLGLGPGLDRVGTRDIGELGPLVPVGGG